MKLIDKRKETEKVKFEDLGEGSVFQFSTDSLYLSVQEHDGVNAINLRTFRPHCFRLNHMVIPVNAQLLLLPNNKE